MMQDCWKNFSAHHFDCIKYQCCTVLQNICHRTITNSPEITLKTTTITPPFPNLARVVHRLIHLHYQTEKEMDSHEHLRSMMPGWSVQQVKQQNFEFVSIMWNEVVRFVVMVY